jgi:integrase
MEARRTKLPGHKGIYYRDVAVPREDGKGFKARKKRLYEITYTDSSKRRRWQVVGPSLEDTEAELAAIKTRLRRGERFSPTKTTLAEIAGKWLEGQKARLRPGTIERYTWGLQGLAIPRIGHLRLNEIDEQTILELVADLRKAGYAAWSIRGCLTPLRRLLGSAVRQGAISVNPFDGLERGELPSTPKKKQRILSRSEIEALLSATTPRYRPLLATLIFTGVRISEALGLRWRDVDFEGGQISIRCQLDRQRQDAPTKTEHAERDVVLMGSLSRLLAAHRLASPFSSDEDYVFATELGTPPSHRNVDRRGFKKAVERAGLGSLCQHDCRHTFASLLIAQGANVVFLSRQLGHANPNITLSVYAHLFERTEHAARHASLLDEAFGNVLETVGRREPQTAAVPAPVELASLQALSANGN